jgi:hypothetical protein
MKLLRFKKPEKSEDDRSKIEDRLSKVKEGANDPCGDKDVKKLVEGLAKGDG